MALQMDERNTAWERAKDLVYPIIVENGIKAHVSCGGLFCNEIMHTEVEQHVDLIIRVADWLLEDKEQ